MSAEQENIISIKNSSARKEEDFKGLKSSLKFLDWALQTQTIIRSLGLPIGDSLTEKETELPIGSMGFQFGHKTVFEFVTKNEEEFGISWNWEKWETYANAFRHKSFYDLHLDDPFEIISQYNDIKSIIGRDPVNSAEFHSAKEQFLTDQKIATHKKHEEERSLLNSQIIKLKTNEISLKSELNDTIKNLESERNNSKFLREDKESLKLKLESIEKEILLLQKNYDEVVLLKEQKIEEARIQGRIEEAELYKKEKESLSFRFEEEKKSIIRSYTSEVSNAKEKAKVAEEQLAFAKINMVDKEEHQNVLNDLNAARQQVQEIILSAHNAETKWLELSGKIQEDEVRIKTLQDISKRQEILIESIKSSSGSSSYSHNDIIALEEKVAKLHGYATSFKDKALIWKNKYEVEKKDSEQLSIQIKEISNQTKALKSEIKKLKGSRNSGHMKYAVSGFILGSVICIMATLAYF